MFRARCLALLLATSACSGDAPDTPEPDAPVTPPDDAPTQQPSIEGTPVSSFETTACETSVVIALARQIADEVNCLMPGQLVTFDETAEIQFVGGAVLPYTSSAGRDDLYAATRNSGMVLQVTSAFRSLVQQYLLYRWYQLGRCGIPLAAMPGSSNHESGRALDISNYGPWITRMGNNGWSHNIPSDPVHFEHLASADIRGAGVLAFQKLWNRNAPDDQIAEDGAFGPQTRERVQRAPAEGFGIGALCAARLALPVRVWPELPAMEAEHAH